MKIVATIKNEKGEKQKFQGETPSQVVMDLAQKADLPGKIFFISVALKRFLSKDIPIARSKELQDGDLPHALQELLKTIECWDCPMYPICPIRQIV